MRATARRSRGVGSPASAPEPNQHPRSQSRKAITDHRPVSESEPASIRPSRHRRARARLLSAAVLGASTLALFTGCAVDASQGDERAGTKQQALATSALSIPCASRAAREITNIRPSDTKVAFLPSPGKYNKLPMIAVDQYGDPIVTGYITDPSAPDDPNWVDRPALCDSPLYRPAGLVVYLHGGGSTAAGSGANFRATAKDMGYHVISLSYPDMGFDCPKGTKKPFDQCTTDSRNEVFTGDPSESGVTSIPQHPEDSIANRLLALLAKLAIVDPDGHWTDFLVANAVGLWTAPAWDQIILTGHSEGSHHAAFIASQVALRRVVLFSGPKDNYDFSCPSGPTCGDGCDLTPPPAGWTASESPLKTDPTRWYALAHVCDVGPSHSSPDQSYRFAHDWSNWVAIGIDWDHRFVGEVSDVPDVGAGEEWKYHSVMVSRSDVYGDCWRYVLGNDLYYKACRSAVPLDRNTAVATRFFLSNAVQGTTSHL